MAVIAKHCPDIQVNVVDINKEELKDGMIMILQIYQFTNLD